MTYKYFQVKRFLVLVILFSGIGLYAQQAAIHEERFISIEGIDQWISLRGDDREKPLILFLHGGPGSVLSPFSETLFAGWEKDFVLAQWDQRGAGRTFGRNAPEEAGEDYWLENPLDLEQMTADGLAVSRYLLSHLGKEKLILVGSSWGSILGVNMALSAPELFSAYMGHAQLVSFAKNLKHAWQVVFNEAQKSGDSIAYRTLRTLGEPPYTSARDLGQLLRIVSTYERAASEPPPPHWWRPSEAYDNEADSKDRYQGDEYSFLYFAGHNDLDISPMAGSVDLLEKELYFEMPVYLIQGSEDIRSAAELNRKFFEGLRAPHKEYVLVPGAGHEFNEAALTAMYTVLTGLPIPGPKE